MLVVKMLCDVNFLGGGGVGVLYYRFLLIFSVSFTIKLALR